MSALTISHLWHATPLLRSTPISDILGCSVYLKLENLHPSYSFKYRGISLFIQRTKEKHGASVHLVIASGGNAGLAAACVANTLSLRCTAYVPDGASSTTISLLKKEHANVVVAGKSYHEALQRAKEALGKEPNVIMVPAYDHPDLWEGHSSMIKEIAAQIPNKPDAIFCSVGGGGLLGGIIVGCKTVGWDDVPIIALETHGSNCFYQSVSLNPGQFNSSKALPADIDITYDEQNDVMLAHLKTLSSRASGSLGASSPAPAVVRMALTRKGGIRCVSIPDELSMQVVERFAEDHKLLVELACSTALSPAYKPSLFSKLVSSASPSEPGALKTVVFIVCGGFKVSLGEIAEYHDQVEADLKGDANAYWDVLYNGETLCVEKSPEIVS